MASPVGRPKQRSAAVGRSGPAVNGASEGGGPPTKERQEPALTVLARFLAGASRAAICALVSGA